MAIIKISKRTVDAALAAEADRAAFLWDTDVKGFGLKVTPSRASYILQYRMEGRGSPTQRYTIGRHGSPWTAEQARQRALDLLAMVRVGTDPVAKEKSDAQEAQRSAATSKQLGFSAYVDVYLKRRVAGQKRSMEVESIFARDLKPYFGSTPVTGIRKSDIVLLLDTVSERNGSAANKAHKALKTFFGWAVARDTIEVSPMAGLPPPAPTIGKPRHHTLSDAELRLVWLAAGDLPDPFDALVRMLIVTGQRLREVAGMTWAEVDLAKKLWTIPKERTKNETTHLVPLSPLALEILAGVKRVKSDKQFVFTTTGTTAVSGFSKSKLRLDALSCALAEKEAPLDGQARVMPAPWRMHDLRRTVATGCERMGISIAVTEAILNHISGSKRGIVGVYQRHSYAEEKRLALTRWAAEVTRIVERGADGEACAVIRLDSARIAKASAN